MSKREPIRHTPPLKGHLDDLCKAILLTKSKSEVRNFLCDLCTPSEIRALSERWHVAQILDQGELSYRDIYDQTGVSTTTIGRVARFLTNKPQQGYRTILDRVKKDKKSG
jgi:TrpR-related protein YerC/YecD